MKKRAARVDPDIEAALESMVLVRAGQQSRLSQVVVPIPEAPPLPTGATLRNYGCDAEIRRLYTRGQECYVVVGEHQTFETLLYIWILDLPSVKWSPDGERLYFRISPHEELKEQDPGLEPITVSVEKASFAYGRYLSFTILHISISSTNLIPSVKLNESYDDHEVHSWDGNPFTFFPPPLTRIQLPSLSTLGVPALGGQAVRAFGARSQWGIILIIKTRPVSNELNKSEGFFFQYFNCFNQQFSKVGFL